MNRIWNQQKALTLYWTAVFFCIGSLNPVWAQNSRSWGSWSTARTQWYKGLPKNKKKTKKHRKNKRKKHKKHWKQKQYSSFISCMSNCQKKLLACTASMKQTEQWLKRMRRGNSAYSAHLRRMACVSLVGTCHDACRRSTSKVNPSSIKQCRSQCVTWVKQGLFTHIAQCYSNLCQLAYSGPKHPSSKRRSYSMYSRRSNTQASSGARTSPWNRSSSKTMPRKNTTRTRAHKGYSKYDAMGMYAAAPPSSSQSRKKSTWTRHPKPNTERIWRNHFLGPVRKTRVKNRTVGMFRRTRCFFRKCKLSPTFVSKRKTNQKP